MKLDTMDRSFSRRWLAWTVESGLPMFFLMWVFSDRPFEWERVILDAVAYAGTCPLMMAAMLPPAIFGSESRTMKLDTAERSLYRRWSAWMVKWGLPMFFVAWAFSDRRLEWETVILRALIYLVIGPLLVAVIVRPLLESVDAVKRDRQDDQAM